MRIKNEADILRPEIRAQIIQEVKSWESQSRKHKSYKWYQCYKDNTREYVIEKLLNQFELDTVKEMSYGIANLSLVRKVVDKLSRVYSNGVVRTCEAEADTKKVTDLAKAMSIDTVLKKTNRFLELQKNDLLYLKPCPSPQGWVIKPEVLQPHLFDVVEDYYDREKPMIYILSDYKPRATVGADIDGTRPATVVPAHVAGPSDSKDNIIADNPVDQGEGEQEVYVFWSDNYHFTTNSVGEIIKDDNNPSNINPFKVAPFVPFGLDQDGSYWAQGGADLIDGAILVNSLISHINHVGVTQGYGQFYITGENLPREIVTGPTRAIIAEYKKDEQAKPEMGFLNANPQLGDLRSLVETYIALLLTTNNLSTTGVSTQLEGGASIPSGIALIIDKAESLEDVQDQRSVFSDREPLLFKIASNIINTYGVKMAPKYRGLALSGNGVETLNVRFNDPTPVMSETERLDNLKKRQELGLDSMLDLLMKDDPSLTHEQAEIKLQKLLEQRIDEKMLEAELMSKNGLDYEDPTGVDAGKANEPPAKNDTSKNED